MEARKVFITLEITTNEKLEDLRRADYWNATMAGAPRLTGTCQELTVIQATANVARSKLGGTHRGKKKP